jgi:uncharacterized protein YjiS (DUF1127 family)
MTMLSNIPGYSPATARSGLENFRRLGISLARFKRSIDRLVAAALAYHARKTELLSLRRLSDRELKDIGIWRYQIGEGLDDAARTRARWQGCDR